jgi:predicted amidophosphoribosyltransferase
MTSYLRCCGGCGGSFAVAYSTNEIWFCPACTKKLPDFDPQPYAIGGPENQRVRYGPHLREYVVLAREGDQVTIRPLGNPDAEEITVNVNVLRPPYITYGR